MSHSQRQVLTLFGLSAVLAALVGVAAAGVYTAYLYLRNPTPIPSPGEGVRIETEFISNAQLASQLPGRVVFKPGSDGLLVISRVHTRANGNADTGADDDTDARDAPPTAIERFWVTVPAGLAVGQAINLHEAYLRGRVAYDAGPYENGRVLSVFCGVDGFIILLGRDERWALVDADFHVNPKGGPVWPVEQLLLAPVEPGGRHALPFNESGDAPVPAPKPAQAIDAAPGERNRKALVGQWFGRYMDGPVPRYDLFAQFDDDGRCVLATRRNLGPDEPYAPEMRYGRFRVVQHWVVITVRKLVVDEEYEMDVDRLDELKTHKLITLRIERGGANDGDHVTLRGDYRWPVSEARGATSDTAIAFKRAKLPDLHTHRPDRRVAGKFEPRPEPADAAR